MSAHIICAMVQALLNSSHKFYDVKTHMAHHGVLVDNPRFDWAAMQKQKDATVAGLTKGIEGLLKKNKVGSASGSIASRGAVPIADSQAPPSTR